MPRALVTGGAGFLGSHLCERLLQEGWDVLCLDTFLTGTPDNVAHLTGESRFELMEYDVTQYLYVPGDLDWVFHFASPASPVDYLEHPIHTMKVGALGTLHGLGLAKAKGAGFMLASTSEAYGDPLVHPQPESYWGNVNPVGPRGVYDEAKRFAEAMTMAFHRTHEIPVHIIRIFNTYGPRMQREDGRAVPNFIIQSLRGEPITVHGDGSQTRSLCYVDDLIEGIYRFLRSDLVGPVNIGNPFEVTVLQLAEKIRDLAGSGSEIRFVERPVDDPERRRPDITLAQTELEWTPETDLDTGLKKTIEWARDLWV